MSASTNIFKQLQQITIWMCTEIRETLPVWNLNPMKWNPTNWAVFKHPVTSSYCLFSIHHLHLHPCLQVTLHFKLPSPRLQLDLLSISFPSASVWKKKKKKHLRETIVGSWFSTLPNFSNLLQTATNKIKREYYSLNTHGKPIPNEKARFWQCSEDPSGNGSWNGTPWRPIFH